MLKSLLRKISNKVFGVIGLELRKKPSINRVDQRTRAEEHKKRTSYSFFDGLLEHMLSYQKERKLSIVQVGANDGITNDPIYPFAKRNQYETRLLLIEPQLDVVEMLQENYRDHPNATIVDMAVSSNSSITLYRIRPDLQPFYKGIIASGITSFNRDHVLRKVMHLPSKLVQTPEEAIEELAVSGGTLTDIIEKTKFKGVIDVLQIDVEGFDDEVIYCSNIGSIKPSIINYEFNNLGEERELALRTYLKGYGYKLIQWNESDIVALLQKHA